MKPVIRRTLFALVLALLLTACGASEPDALAVGDRSISRSAFNDYSLVLNGFRSLGDDGDVAERPSRLPADNMRRDATQWLNVSAIVQVLETRDIVLPDTENDVAGERLLAEQFLQQASAAGQIGEVDSGNPAYDYLVELAWLINDPEIQALVADPEVQTEWRQVLEGDVHVDSRVGVWLPDVGQIVTERSLNS
jgi:hypothetical protein